MHEKTYNSNANEEGLTADFADVATDDEVIEQIPALLQQYDAIIATVEQILAQESDRPQRQYEVGSREAEIEYHAPGFMGLLSEGRRRKSEEALEQLRFIASILRETPERVAVEAMNVAIRELSNVKAQLRNQGYEH